MPQEWTVLKLSQHTWDRHLGIYLLVSGPAARVGACLRLPLTCTRHSTGYATRVHRLTAQQDKLDRRSITTPPKPGSDWNRK